MAATRWKSIRTPSAKARRVLIVDDLLATGGTARAVTQLVEQLGGTVAGLGFVVELTFLERPRQTERIRRVLAAAVR